MSQNINRQVAYGKSQGLIDIFNDPVVALRDPVVNDKADIGQLWVNKTLNTVWMLTSFVGGAAIWTELDNSGGGAGNITWTTEAGGAVVGTNNHGYILIAGPTTVTLPAVSPVGSEIIIIGRGAPWIIQALLGDTIRFGQNTSAGGGTATSVHGYATATIITTVANAAFEIVSSNDNLLIA